MLLVMLEKTVFPLVLHKGTLQICMMIMFCFPYPFCCKHHIDFVFYRIVVGGLGDLYLDCWQYFGLLTNCEEMLVCGLQMAQLLSQLELIFFLWEVIIFQFFIDDKSINTCNIYRVKEYTQTKTTLWSSALLVGRF